MITVNRKQVKTNKEKITTSRNNNNIIKYNIYI